MHDGLIVLLLTHQILMWSWLHRHQCTVEFMSFNKFWKKLQSNENHHCHFSKYSAVWGGVDLVVDPRYVMWDGWVDVQGYV